MASESRAVCVTNCIVPSCNTITCSRGEFCVVSAQTCEACPQVSCAALARTGNALAPAKGEAFPVGAIVGVVLATLLLALGLAYLAFRHRRQVAAQRQAAALEEEGQEGKKNRPSAYLSGFGDAGQGQPVGMDDAAGPFPDTATAFKFWRARPSRGTMGSTGSVPICLGPGIHAHRASDGSFQGPQGSVATSRVFFGAEELMRMSYAESTARSGSDRRASSMMADGKRNTMDSGPAIMQTVNHVVTGQRVKPSVVQLKQLNKGSSSMSSTPPLTTTATLSHLAAGTTLVRGVSPLVEVEERSAWEEDSEDPSPVERDILSRASMQAAAAAAASQRRVSMRKSAARALTESSSDAAMGSDERDQGPAV